MPEVAALVLAAGRASRFRAAPDTSKVFAELAGRTLIAHAADAALGSCARPVIVVTGQGRERAHAALAGRAVRLVHNAGYATGMAGSLKIGIDALPEACEGALVLLGDMPLVRSRTLDEMIAAFARERPDAVVPCLSRRRGNPALIGRSLFAQIMLLEGDAGARAVLADPRHHVLEREVDDPGIFTDVDTPEALAALKDGSRRT